jgi:oligopeptide transport system ATP-binding protein
VNAVIDVHELVTCIDTLEGALKAVNGLSFRVEEGETLAIVGESGSGKSMSMLSLLQLLPSPPARVANGKVMFKGRDLRKLSKREMRRVKGAEIGIIFQDPMSSLNPVLTVGYQIKEAIRLHEGVSRKEAKSRAVGLMNLVGIPAAETRYGDFPHQFSGGMRQRVMIAMALSCQPSLLIADEPTTALDVTIQAQILRLVQELKDKLGMSVIWITHDLGVVARIAQRVIVMYAGSVVEEADVQTFYANPRHPYSRGLLRSLPKVSGSIETQLEAIHGQPPSLTSKFPGCPFALRCGYATDICMQNPPPLETTGGDPRNRTACFHWQEI